MQGWQAGNLIHEFIEQSKNILRDNLVGIYLHGSAAMGCFNPEKSDIDLITVVDHPMSDDAKRAYMDMVIKANAMAPAKGIEMSIVLREACKPFVYPTPFELHFSVGHLEAYKADPDGYIQRMKGVDKDLAAHFTIINKRGQCLYGAPIREVFAEVPHRDYMDSIWCDVSDAADEITQYPMYLILNLARVLAYKEDGLILSKKEGGEWAINHLPVEFHPLIRDAMNEYTEGKAVDYDEALAKRYAECIVRQIAQ